MKLINSIIFSITSMKKRCINNTSQFQSINQTVCHSLEKVQSIKMSNSISLLSINAIKAIQSQLLSLQGYTISSKTIHYLTNYCDYHSLLRSIICNKSSINTPKNRFLNEYSQMHSQDSMSKLFNKFIVKDREIIKRNKMYSQQCLVDYFGLHDFLQQKIQNTLLRRIIQAKRKGMIEMQEKKKKQKTYYNFNLKQNKSNIVLHQTKKKNNLIFEESQLYYSILALKLLLKETLPNMPQINKICQEIKINLQLYLSNLKIKNSTGIKSHRSSIFKKQ